MATVNKYLQTMLDLKSDQVCKPEQHLAHEKPIAQDEATQALAELQPPSDMEGDVGHRLVTRMHKLEKDVLYWQDKVRC